MVAVGQPVGMAWAAGVVGGAPTVGVTPVPRTTSTFHRLVITMVLQVTRSDTRCRQAHLKMGKKGCGGAAPSGRAG